MKERITLTSARTGEKWSIPTEEIYHMKELNDESVITVKENILKST